MAFEQGFRTDVNALRAAAVLLVVSVHAAGQPVAGWVGVDVFFVISGYLVMRSVLAERLRTGAFSLGRFLRRRFWRLLPAAVVTLFAVAVAAWTTLRPALASAVASDGAAAAIGVVNWVFLGREADYWASPVSASPFQHFWSLSVELQWYVAFPVVLIVVWGLLRVRGRGAVRAAVWLCAAIVLVSGAWAVVEGATDPGRAYFDTGTRVWELAAGALLGALSMRADHDRGPLAVRSRIRALGVLSGFALIGLAALTGPGADAVPVPDALLGVAGALVVLAAGQGLRPLPLLRSRVVQWIGDASYSIYLWHFPAIIAVGYVLPDHRQLGAVVAVLAGLVLGGASRRWVELPSIRAGRGTHGSRLFAGAVAVTAATSVFLAVTPTLLDPHVAAGGADDPMSTGVGRSERGWSTEALADAIDAGVSSTSWPARLAPGLDDIVPGPPNGYADCDWTEITDPGSCRFGPDAADRDVVVVGSSVGVALMPAAVGAFASDSTVRGLTASGCPMIRVTVRGKSDAQHRRCAEQRAAAVTEINASRPDLVIVTHGYDGVEQLVGSRSLTENAAVWQRAATGFVDAVRPSGARVVFVGATPGGKDPARCAALRTSLPAGCATELSAAYRAGAEAERHVAAADPAVDFVDSSLWYCDGQGRCPAVAGDVLVRKDVQHITQEFSERLGPALRTSVFGSAG